MATPPELLPFYIRSKIMRTSENFGSVSACFIPWVSRGSPQQIRILVQKSRSIFMSLVAAVVKLLHLDRLPGISAACEGGGSSARIPIDSGFLLKIMYQTSCR